MHYYLNLGLFFFLDLLKRNAFVPACLRWNQFHLLVLHQHLLLLYTAFTVAAFFTIITAIKFKATTKVKMLFLSFRKFFDLNPACCHLQNFDYYLTNYSSLLRLIIIDLSSTHFLYFVDSCFQQLDFMRFFLNFASSIVKLVLIDFELLANKFHHQLVFHFHRKLGMDITMDLFRISISSLQLHQHHIHFKMVCPFYQGFRLLFCFQLLI